MSDSTRHDKAMRRLKLRRWLSSWRALAVVTVPSFIGWVLHDYTNIRKHAPMIWQDVRATLRSEPAQTTPETATATSETKAPAPETKPAESKKVITGSLPTLPMLPQLPCDLSVTNIPYMLERSGLGHERSFELLFVRRNACIALPLTGVNDRYMKFETWSLFRPNSPTIYVQPAVRADLSRYPKGAKLKVEGRWQRYVRTSDGPDEILVTDARVTQVE